MRRNWYLNHIFNLWNEKWFNLICNDMFKNPLGITDLWVSINFKPCFNQCSVNLSYANTWIFGYKHQIWDEIRLLFLGNWFRQLEIQNTFLPIHVPCCRKHVVYKNKTTFICLIFRTHHLRDSNIDPKDIMEEGPLATTMNVEPKINFLNYVIA